MEFYTIAIIGELALLYAGVMYGSGGCSKNSDAFIIAVLEVAVDDGGVVVPDGDSYGGVCDGAGVYCGVGCSDFDAGGVETRSMVSDRKIF